MTDCDCLVGRLWAERLIALWNSGTHRQQRLARRRERYKLDRPFWPRRKR